MILRVTAITALRNQCLALLGRGDPIAKNLLLLGSSASRRRELEESKPGLVPLAFPLGGSNQLDDDS